MPDLQHRFRTHDLGFLQIVASLWGVDLTAPDARSALPKLMRALLDPELAVEIVEALPDGAHQALDALINNEGWMAWPRFTLKFGQLREVGPGKRDREKPYLEPVSSTEVLWYRGLIGRDFLMREGELQECAYIPNDLLKLPVTKLREIALSLEVIQGVHGMKKEQLLQEICDVKGIENPYQKEAARRKAAARASIIEMKAQRKTLRAELGEQKKTLSKDEKKAVRGKIKKLRRETRRLADV